MNQSPTTKLIVPMECSHPHRQTNKSWQSQPQGISVPTIPIVYPLFSVSKLYTPNVCSPKQSPFSPCPPLMIPYHLYILSHLHNHRFLFFYLQHHKFPFHPPTPQIPVPSSTPQIVSHPISTTTDSHPIFYDKF